jgi:hypothetical protein
MQFRLKAFSMGISQKVLNKNLSGKLNKKFEIGI